MITSDSSTRKPESASKHPVSQAEVLEIAANPDRILRFYKGRLRSRPQSPLVSVSSSRRTAAAGSRRSHHLKSILFKQVVLAPIFQAGP